MSQSGIDVNGPSEQAGSSGYWYPGATDQDRAREVLESLRLYRAAERAMRRRTRDEMSMGENDLLTLRFLFRQPGRVARPSALAAYLGVSSAAATVIIDRLERSGHLQRSTQADDPRIALVGLTDHADDDVRQTLGAMHEAMHGVAAGMDPQAQGQIIAFLRAMADAVDGIAPVTDSAD